MTKSIFEDDATVDLLRKHIFIGASRHDVRNALLPGYRERYLEQQRKADMSIPGWDVT